MYFYQQYNKNFRNQAIIKYIYIDATIVAYFTSTETQKLNGKRLTIKNCKNVIKIANQNFSV